MKRLLALPALVRAGLVLIALQVGLGTLFRVVFWLRFRSTAGEAAAADWAQAWYLGLKFDLRLALWICLPFLVLSLVPFLHPARSRLASRFWQLYFVATQGLVVLVYLVDLGNYDYLQVRMDAGMLDLISSPAIALGMVWETYPVPLVVLIVVVAAVAYSLLIRRTAFRLLAAPGRSAGRSARRLALTTFAILYALAIYGKWSWYPLRWSDAFFSTEPFVAALALNPVLYFVDTLPNRESPATETLDLDRFREVAGLLDVETTDMTRPSLERSVAPTSPRGTTPNLVVIHLESFSAYKTGAFGNPLGATPHFDALAREAYLFTNFFVPSGPTARAIFTMTTGTPDLNPVRSASRNPKAVRQHMVLNALREHDKFYFLGGSATWGNIRGLIAHNLDNLEIYEEGSYEASRGDVWGISDLQLFEAAHEVLRQQTRPFFAFIQTAGNHRPYTIPDDRRGFELADLDSETLRANGFESLEALNGLRFLDHSLGRFLELARQEPYFSNTVFAFYGDHGGPTPLPTPWNTLGLTTNHVPGVIFAPGLLAEGRRIDSVGSLVDLVPTSLSLMGVPYVNTTLGRDLLAERPPEEHFALIWDGVITDRFLLKIDPQGTAHLYEYRSEEAALDVAERFPEQRDRLRRLYGDLEAVSRYLLYNNPPVPHERAAAAVPASPE